MKTQKEMIEALINGKVLVNRSKQQISLCDDGFVRIRINDGGAWGNRHDAIVNFRPENWVLQTMKDTVNEKPKFKADRRVKVNGHPHCAIMAEYAEVAKTTDKPWEEFEVYTNAYNGTDNNGWANLRCHPAWNVEYKYRRKLVNVAEPKIIVINGNFCS